MHSQIIQNGENFMKKLLLLLLLTPFMLMAQPKIALQVLGSGGPESGDKRASKVKVGSLILSHRMLRTLGKEKETKKEIRKSYKGPLKFANDLSFYKVR